MARRPQTQNKPAVAEEAAEATATKEKVTKEGAVKETITVMLVHPYPQVMPETGIRFMRNERVIVPNNAWVQARLKDGLLTEVA